ncbi:transposase [Bradyrhizobium sp. USDA 4506]
MDGSQRGDRDACKMLVEAAWSAKTVQDPLRALHRVQRKHREGVAAVAMARALAMMIWHTTTTRKDYGYSRLTFTAMKRGTFSSRQGAAAKSSRGQVEARLANMSRCVIGMEACVGAHHLSRKLASFGNNARLMPAKYVCLYSKGQTNDFNDAEAIARSAQRPTMKFVATKTAEQLGVETLHRMRE